MNEKQPEALRANELNSNAFFLASIAEKEPWRLKQESYKEIAALLRTQHADIERKDALLRQALEALETSRSLEPVDVDWVKGKREATIESIRKELQ